MNKTPGGHGGQGPLAFNIVWILYNITFTSRGYEPHSDRGLLRPLGHLTSGQMCYSVLEDVRQNVSNNLTERGR